MTPLSNYPLYIRPGKWTYRFVVKQNNALKSIFLYSKKILFPVSSPAKEVAAAITLFHSYEALAKSKTQDYALAKCFINLSKKLNFGSLLYASSLLCMRGYYKYGYDLLRLVPLEVSAPIVPLTVAKFICENSTDQQNSNKFWRIICQHASTFPSSVVEKLIAYSLYESNSFVTSYLIEVLQLGKYSRPYIASALASVSTKNDKNDTNLSLKSRYRVGVMSYRSPSYNSINIGDYIQTTAYLGCIARINYKDVVGCASSAFSQVQNLCRPTEKSNNVIELFEFYRDCSFLNKSSKELISYFPVFGWHMRDQYGKYELDFDERCIPFFFSIHINNNRILTPHVLSVFRKYSPIGCRDINTLRLLRSHDIPSFFSGCVTKTIGMNLSKITTKKKLLRKVSGVYEYKAHKIKKNRKKIIHTDNMLPLYSLDKCIKSSVNILKSYANAVGNETDLLHSYLPSRSLGCEVVFKHSNPSDNRFEGLIGVSEEDFQNNSRRLQDLLDATHSYIDKNVPDEASFRSFWKLSTEPLCSQSDCLITDQRTAAFKAIDVCNDTITNALKDIQPIHSISGRVIVLSTDKNWANHTERLIERISECSNGSLTICILCRNCEIQTPRVRKNIICKQVRVDCFKFDNVKLLGHTTVSTMDRLLIPRILPNALTCLYLDVDIKISGVLDELIDYELGDCLLAARQSIEPDWSDLRNVIDVLVKGKSIDEGSFVRKIIYATCQFKSKMFNAGVLKMNLEKMREVDAHIRMLSISYLTGLNDQYSMNVVVDGDYAKLPARFNYFFNREAKPVSSNLITHYVGSFKPWTLK
jgi:lipopolysaccharide biosynthesis glycosyltransferase